MWGRGPKDYSYLRFQKNKALTQVSADPSPSVKSPYGRGDLMIRAGRIILVFMICNYKVNCNVVWCDLGKTTLNLTFLICKLGMIMSNS